MPLLKHQIALVCVMVLTVTLAACSFSPNDEIEIRETWITMADGVRLAVVTQIDRPNPG